LTLTKVTVSWHKHSMLRSCTNVHEVHKSLALKKKILLKGNCSVIYPASLGSPATITNRICSSQQVNKSRNKFKFYLLLSSKNSALLKQLSWRQTTVALLRWNMQCKSEKTSSFPLSSDRLSFNTKLLIKEERRRLYDFSLTSYFSIQLLFLFKLV
jgi:hypothetical protein